MSTLGLLAEIVLVLQLPLFALFTSAILTINTENSLIVGSNNWEKERESGKIYGLVE